jgi:hypothetical protein
MAARKPRKARGAGKTGSPPEMVGGVQLDLFGEVEARTEARQELERRARTMPDGSPVVWVAPYDCPAAKKGEAIPGWRCWLCGQIEVNEFVLNLNHGLTSVYPETLDWTECSRQRLLASQARSAATRSTTTPARPTTRPVAKTATGRKGKRSNGSGGDTR